jgi:enoyl-[acyl-carrier-protein] reductase (NADH)
MVVLGGAGGIAGAVTRACLERSDAGRPVWITYRSDRTSAAELAGSVDDARIVQCDVTDAAAVAELGREIAGSGHGVSTVLHAAVDAVPGALLELGSERLGAAMDVSALSLVTALGALEPVLVDSAAVVFLTSIGSSRVVPGYGAVGIAKAAAEAIVRYLAAELGGRGIRVNAVSSGPVLTKALTSMFDSESAQKMVSSVGRRSPLQPPIDVQDVARFVAALCGADGRGVTGQVIAVDGGAFLGA